MSRMPSTMHQGHTFAQVPSAEHQRSSFDRSHGLKTTINSGYLYPIFCDEVLPGDTFSLHMQGFARLSTPLKPVMDNSYFNTFFFFVPNRLLWDKWQRLMGEQPNPGDSTDFLVPQITAPAGGWAVGSLSDYFGLPTGIAGIKSISLYHRAYNLIWNEWFRDENLQTRAPQHIGDTEDPDADYTLLRRGKRHDYFTSCLPWPQKGESVSIPLGQTAPVSARAADVGPIFKTATGGTAIHTPAHLMFGASQASWFVENGAPTGSGQTIAAWDDPGLTADLSLATSATINQLRQAFQIQRLYERDARGGTRYTEIIRSHFGVVSPDARLQRPEYLGGGQSSVLISQVAQTSASAYGAAADTPQGNLAAFGTASLNGGHGFSKAFTEHGVIIGLVSVRADLNYQQGLDRKFSRRSRFDFYWPALSHIGEQAVLNKEIYCDGTAADEDVFGYQERYAEYRYAQSKITGEFRSTYVDSLDVWHLAQEFGTRPALNANFIEDNPPFDRVVAVPSEPTFIGDFWFNLRCARPMPVFGVPGMIDHF